MSRGGFHCRKGRGRNKDKILLQHRGDPTEPMCSCLNQNSWLGGDERNILFHRILGKLHKYRHSCCHCLRFCFLTCTISSSIVGFRPDFSLGVSTGIVQATLLPLSLPSCCHSSDTTSHPPSHAGCHLHPASFLAGPVCRANAKANTARALSLPRAATATASAGAWGLPAFLRHMLAVTLLLLVSHLSQVES